MAVEPIKDRAEARAAAAGAVHGQRSRGPGCTRALMIGREQSFWGRHLVLRLSDIANLKWESLNLDEKLLRLQTQKTGAVIVAPLHGNFLKWLGERPRDFGKACVFPALAGRRTAGRKGLSTQFRNIMLAAGVVGRVGERRGQEGRTRNSKSFQVYATTLSRNSLIWASRPTSGKSWPVIHPLRCMASTRTTRSRRCERRFPDFLHCSDAAS